MWCRFAVQPLEGELQESHFLLTARGSKRCSLRRSLSICFYIYIYDIKSKYIVKIYM